MSTFPLKTNRPFASSTTASDSTSYSSRISPTISSSRSSMRDEAGRAAVLVHDDRALRLLALELLQEIRHPLGLGHHHRGPQHARNRPGVVAGVEKHEILDEREAGDIVETALVDGEPSSIPARGTARGGPQSSRPRGSRRCRGAASSPRAPAYRRSRRCSAADGAPRPAMIPSCSPLSRVRLRDVVRLPASLHRSTAAPSRASAPRSIARSTAPRDSSSRATGAE